MNPRTPLIATAAALAALAFAGSASAATTFSNPNPISPHDRPSGSPFGGVDSDNYPSTIDVHGVAGSIEHVQVKLHDVSSTFPADLDVMLVGPDNTSVMLMSDNGAGNDMSGADLTFDDGAAKSLPDDAPIPSGAYKPSNIGLNDEFPDLGDASGTALGQFDGRDPNGGWRLHVIDDSGSDLSTIAGGWELTLTTDAGAIVRSRAQISALDRNADTDPPAAASPYPSAIDVAGLPGTIAKVSVTLHRFVSKNPEDADLMLVGPNGKHVILLSDGFNIPVDGTITLDDLARFPAPKQQGQHQSQYQTANYDSGQPDESTGDFFPSPAPVPPHSSQLSAAFGGISPNGKWQLYLTDDHHDGAGVKIENGWSLNFTLHVPPPKPTPKPVPQPQPQPATLTSLSLKAKKFAAKKGTTVRYGLSASAQVRFRVQRRTASGGFKTLRGSIQKAGVAGPNRFRFRGKVGGKRLKPGSYRLRASVAGGNSRKVRFRIVK